MLNPTPTHSVSQSQAAAQRSSASSSTSSIVASPAKVLYNVMRRRISGRLVIRSSQEMEAAWVVYAGEGKLHFVSSTVGEKDRLEYILRRTRSSLLTRLTTNFKDSAYSFLHQEWDSERITINQLHTFIRLFTQEALVHILAIPQAVIQFDQDARLTPALVSLSLKDLIPPIAAQIGAWKSFKPSLHSPLQPLCVTEQQRFEQELMPAIESLQPASKQSLSLQLLADQPSLYQLAARLNVDILQLAKLIAQGIESRWVETVSSKRQEEQTAKPTVVCIDDSVTVQRNVKLILEAAGYRMVGLTNPLQALSSLAREKPALILMDISMPNLDGYELCRLLRQSALLKETPIVMLTGRDGFIDKVRAKVAGSTDYITKPFNADALLATIENHIEGQIENRIQMEAVQA